MSLKRCLSLLVSFAFLGACSPEVGKQYIKPDDIKDIKQDKPIGKYAPPKVDILFVIDDSGSMGSYQAALTKNLPIFLNEFTTKTDINYNIAVINSTCSSRCGNFVGTTKVVNRSTVDGLNILKRNVVVGTGGDTEEKFFDPLVAAFTEPTLSTVNKDFLRKRVPLAVIFLTDAQDQSRQNDAKRTLDFLVKVKDNKPENLLGYGVYIPQWFMNMGCDTDDGNTPGTKISEFLGMVSNANPAGNAKSNSFFLCGNFETKLIAIGQDIANRVGRTFLLNDLPAKGTIEVFYGDAPVPQNESYGWVFDIGRNAVIIGPDFKWDPPGSNRQITVRYEIATTVETRN